MGLSPQEIGAYGAIIVALLLPYINGKLKTKGVLDVKDKDYSFEVNRELRKENDRLIIENKKLTSDLTECSVEKAVAKDNLKDALEKIAEYKESVKEQGNKLMAEGDKLVEEIKSNAQINIDK